MCAHDDVTFNMTKFIFESRVVGLPFSGISFERLYSSSFLMAVWLSLPFMGRVIASKVISLNWRYRDRTEQLIVISLRPMMTSGVQPWEIFSLIYACCPFGKTIFHRPHCFLFSLLYCW